MPVICDEAEVVIKVTPLADTWYAGVDENGQVTLCPAEIAQIEGPIVSLATCDDPQHGTLAVLPSLCVVYSPDADYHGMDTVCLIQCDTTILVLTVNPVNDMPFAADDYAETSIDTPVEIDVTGNDNDNTDGGMVDPASVTIAQPAVHGTVSVNPQTGAVTYVPAAGYIGQDSFSYVVCDLGDPLPALCDTAWVYVTVTPLTGQDCFIPESFSPNGDGLYDAFVIPCAEFFPEIELAVYNRWGDQVYASGIEYRNDWDGFWDKKASDLPDGTYYWIVKFNDGLSPDRAGYVYLLR